MAMKSSKKQRGLTNTASELINAKPFSYSLLLLWLIIVATLSVIPVHGKGLLENSDKFLHLLSYLITCCLFYLCFKDKMRGVLYRSFLCSFFFGLLMEVIQAFLPHRDFSWGDIFFNLTGALGFVAVYPLFKKITTD